MNNQRNAGSYKRLVTAALLLRGWHSNKEIMHGLTLGGLDVSPQKLCNWKSRGVARPAMIDVARIIGCRGEWLQTGAGEMTDGQAGISAAGEKTGNDRLAATPEERDLLAGFRRAPSEVRDTALYMLRRYLIERPC